MTVPQQGSLSDSAFLEVICDLHRQGSTGCLTVSDGQVDRSYYLREGVLVATEGGSDSETLDALRANLPDAPENQLQELQSTLHVLNCTNLNIGSWQFQSGAAPEQDAPADLSTTCWKAVERKLDINTIRTRLADDMEEFPTVSGARVPLSSLPVSEEIKEFLSTIDGQRTLGEILDFSPLDPIIAARSLYFAHLVGALLVKGRGREVAITVTDAPAPPSADPTPDEEAPASPSAPAPSSDVLNIANLIAGEVGGPAAVPEAGPAGEMALSEDSEIRVLQETLQRLENAENAFEVIGLEWDADDETYRTTYFDLARAYHPDAWASKSAEKVELVDRIFALISTAWQDLGEAESRQAYIDKTVHGLKDENELAMERVKEILKAEADFDKAVAHFRAGRIVQAHEILTTCVEQVPDATEFRAYLGYTTWKLHEERNPEEAQKGEDMLKQAMQGSVKLDDGWVLLGQIYKAKDLEDLAKMSFVKALKINPSNEFAVREMKRLSRGKSESKSGGGLFGIFKRKKKSSD